MLYWVAIATTYFRVCVVNMDHFTTYSNIDIILAFLTLPSTMKLYLWCFPILITSLVLDFLNVEL